MNQQKSPTGVSNQYRPDIPPEYSSHRIIKSTDIPILISHWSINPDGSPPEYRYQILFNSAYKNIIPRDNFILTDYKTH
ncbi:unnamed protein product [Gordionus sp. m RMFG-2023]